MKSFMVMTFALLGCAWYSLSGGANFEPGIHSVQLPNLIAGGFATPAAAQPAQPAAPTPEVTRASAASLADVSAPDSQSPQSAMPVKATKAALDVTLAAVPAKPISASFDAESGIEALAPASAAAAPPAELRQVTGTRVNLRYGPGTDYSVVGQLAEGDEVEVLSDPGDGWVKLQARGGGTAGWMYDAYLSAAN